ncbi:arabinan endo-1,5-alpha-L-arabinosidase [Carboxylicivirga linearis]|uniref:Arabinan endo-1,5-alpha-L-arabinosidase n=1 Tax=Carboxylicivirga linearis TaxID=1628157 RepID=A0ABS5K1Q6_9BACT|nr:arabinan endo-1,5-alpha-L-arabinosidase [Carboxylicivirga linearis]MBS2101035.1 arabinan endo-1,5-alpha-L-arabinosidase [Carboxylicivirga linearis]
MNKSYFLLIMIISLLLSISANAQRRHFRDLTGKTFPLDSIRSHDPVIIKQDSVYYVFATGFGISVISSTDMENWTIEKPVFAEAPKWATEAIPEYRGHTWAPDISYFNGQYYLYYSVSAFGKNTSCIGVATNKTLHPSDPDFKWVDHGKVIQSFPGKTNWNAIDGNLILDENDAPWLSFGSFWGGLQLVQLSDDGLSPAQDINTFATIASRRTSDEDRRENSIEAPFIYQKGDYYYLFASIDFCCRGMNSTYKIIIGRSKTIQGPYLDKEGKRMDKGGGTILLQGNDRWAGVGHNGAAHIDGKDILVYHGYDRQNNGASKLLIKEMKWVDGWPVIDHL